MTGTPHDWSVTLGFLLTVAILLPICCIVAVGILDRKGRR